MSACSCLFMLVHACSCLFMLVQVFPPSQVLAPHQQVSVPVFGKKPVVDVLLMAPFEGLQRNLESL
jgi:hypothetical protein